MAAGSAWISSLDTPWRAVNGTSVPPGCPESSDSPVVALSCFFHDVCTAITLTGPPDTPMTQRPWADADRRSSHRKVPLCRHDRATSLSPLAQLTKVKRLRHTGQFG